MYSLSALLLQTYLTQYKLQIYLAFAATIHILRKITGMLTKVIPDPAAQNWKEPLFINIIELYLILQVLIFGSNYDFGKLKAVFYFIYIFSIFFFLAFILLGL